MSHDKARIGWIGSGRMGTAMATRLIDGENDVIVANRARAKAEVLAELGATIADRYSDLADCDFVFVMVSADSDVLEVTLGTDGVLTNQLLAPKVLIDCSTISIEASAKVRRASTERQIEFLAAPVSGNPSVVKAGQLTLAVSGERGKRRATLEPSKCLRNAARRSYRICDDT